MSTYTMKPTFLGEYSGMKPSEALRHLHKRYIRKLDCQDMLNRVAFLLENLEDEKTEK